ncbi:MAG: hypothetical protein WBV39_10695 [Rudaea sp.]
MTTAAELQNALNQAALNTGEYNFIVILAGTYSTVDNGGSPFTYSSTTTFGLYLIGGTGTGCPGDTHPRILDGGAVSAVLDLHSIGGDITLENLTIQNGIVPQVNPTGDEGAGLRINTAPGDGGGVSVFNCIIRDNHTYNATSPFSGLLIEVRNNRYLNFDNNLVVGNTAITDGAAGVIYADNTISSSYVNIANNTVTNNTSQDSGAAGGMIFNGVNGGLFADNIFRNNSNYGLVLNYPALLLHNDYGTLGGTASPAPGSMGNVQVNARFVDAANGDYHLSAASPLIGLGRVSDLCCSGVDLDGHQLPHAGRLDLGAYQETIFGDGFDGD